ncbi:MAG: hypothetical protein OXI46_07280 [Gemmatimonadota bacterium]|nr:hypothetical protein [Gemmatimonadota bacterium]
MAASPVPAQALTAGESATINLAPAFTDPDGDALSYAATSSNTAVATVSVSGSVLTISAVGAGETTVNVTATDAGGLSASLQVAATVTPANRVPVAASPVPAQALTVGESATVNLAPAFTDPDGDALSYAATSSNTAVATVSVSGSVLTISAVASGTAMVTATATDPGGLSASHTVAVTVTGGGTSGTVLRDDFDSSASLSDWELANARASVSAGVLRLTDTSTERSGRARRSLGSVITEWEVGVRMGRVQTGQGHGASVVLRTGHSRYPAISFDIGSFSYGNFGLWFFDRNESRWITEEDLVGTSSAISTGSGEFTDIVAEFKNGEVRAVAGGVTLFETRLGSTIPTEVMEVELWVLSPTGESGGTALFDRIAVDGESGGGGGSTPATYQTGETVSTLPTGFWTPDVTSRASFQFSSGQITITFNNGGYIEEAGIRYTCRASGGCHIEGRVVVQGTIEASGGGGGGSNRSPETVGSISDRTMTAGEMSTVDASSYFSDPDGDQLTYTARSSRTSAATVSVSGSEVTVAAVAQGSATIRVTATDPGGLSAEQSFTVTVETGGGSNRSPETVGSISDRTMTAGEMSTVDASSYFSDPDGDQLTYTARSSRTSAATVSASGSEVTVAAVVQGSATIRITATDPGGLSAEQSFSVTVEAGGGGDFEAFSGLRINNNGSVTLRVGGINLSVGNTGCIRGGGTFNGRLYDYHWSAWQRNTGSGWSEVAGSRRTGGLCGYDLTSAPSGRYRLVGDMTIAGVRGNYRSENEVTR